MRPQLALTGILWNPTVGGGCYRMGIAGMPEMAAAVPGQFVMIRVAAHHDALLNRPFSVHRLLASEGRFAGFELLYKAVGPVTGRMAQLQAGDALAVLGPLGHGFSVLPGTRRVALVAGGIGVAPLLFLAETLVRQGFSPKAIAVYIGGRSAAELLCAEDFRRLGCPVTETTDDGSAGDQCLVTHPLEADAAADPAELICACGPLPMLACVAGIARAHNVPCQVSIEARMACGMGACLGCAVPAPGKDRPFHHACLDGPVLEADRIDFDAFNFH